MRISDWSSDVCSSDLRTEMTLRYREHLIEKRGRQAWESAIAGRLADRSHEMPQVKGEFEVSRSMEPGCDLGDGVEAMHVRFDKTFNGPLTASSVVHMLAVMTAVENSAGYVAVEQIGRAHV